jgi:predicted SprT family Zn-dependent metalloprotease
LNERLLGLHITRKHEGKTNRTKHNEYKCTCGIWIASNKKTNKKRNSMTILNKKVNNQAVKSSPTPTPTPTPTPKK